MINLRVGVFLNVIFLANSLLGQNITNVYNFGGNDYDNILYLKIDSLGNKIILSECSPDLSIAQDSLYPLGSTDVYLFKQNDTDSILWSKHFGLPEASFNPQFCLTIDGSGNIIAGIPIESGFSYGDIIFCEDSVFMYDSTFCFPDSYCSYTILFKFSPDGKLLWTKKSFYPVPITADNNDYLYMHGEYNNSDTAYLLQKVDSMGNLIWNLGYTCDNPAGIQSITTNNSGNILVAGYYYTNICLGPFTLNSAGNDDAYITLVDSNGNYLWAKSAGGTDYENLNMAVFDNQGNIYFVGNAKDDMLFDSMQISSYYNYYTYVAKYRSDGEFLWVKALDGVYTPLNDIATDREGNLFLLSAITENVDLGNGVFISFINSASNCILIKLDSNGVAQWGVNLGGGQNEGNSLVIGRDSTIYTAEYYYDHLNFDLYDLNSYGAYDVCIITLEDNQDITAVNVMKPVAHQFSIVPNPANDHIMVNFDLLPGDGEISIYDLRGREVLRNKVLRNENHISLSLKTLTPELFIIKLETAFETFTEKLVVK
ncbi:MAG: T9SS type A sorting domain-containing protein [Chitinophagales bacterium]